MTDRQATNGLEMVEGVTDAIVNRLRTSLPGKLRAMYAEYSDDIELPAPKAYYTPMTDTPSPLNIEYPSVLVMGASASNSINSEGMRGDTFMGDMALTYPVFVFPLLKGETEPRLQKMLYRYVIAVVEVLCGAGALGPNYECHFVFADYQNPAVSSEDDLIRDVPIEFVVMSVESY